MIIMTLHEQIRDILLAHEGKEQAINSTSIADMIGIDPGGSNIIIRKKILETIIHYELPVASTNSGYYLLKENDDDDLKRYQSSLNHRALEITSRSVLIRHFFNKYYNKGELELTSEIFDEDAGDSLDI